MNAISRLPNRATVMLDPRHQTKESVLAIVEEIFRLSGCPACGRAALLHMDLVSDPEHELTKKQGVISAEFHSI
jgi:hypothetical protein